MTDQGDVVSWLETAISEREMAAAEAAAKDGARWYYDHDAGYVLARCEGDMVATGSQDFLDRPQGHHIALHDPESVLRRCAADRKLIAAHPITRDVITVLPDGTHGFGCSVCHHEDLYVVGDGWCTTLLALAEGYGWRPGT